MVVTNKNEKLSWLFRDRGNKVQVYEDNFWKLTFLTFSLWWLSNAGKWRRAPWSNTTWKQNKPATNQKRKQTKLNEIISIILHFCIEMLATVILPKNLWYPPISTLLVSILSDYTAMWRPATHYPVHCLIYKLQHLSAMILQKEIWNIKNCHTCKFGENVGAQLPALKWFAYYCSQLS